MDEHYQLGHPATLHADTSHCSQCGKGLLTVKGKVRAIKDQYGESIRICNSCYLHSARLKEDEERENNLFNFN